MFIIFGWGTRINKSSKNDIISNGCPECGNDLRLSELKNWIDIFFIPIIPLNTIQTFYHCKECDSTYKEEAREILIGSTIEQEKLQKAASEAYARALVACTTQMAVIDGDYASEEETVIHSTADQFPNMKDELMHIIEQIKANPQENEEYVYNLLRDCLPVITAEGIMLLIAQAANVLLADGKIDKAEEALMKEYLLICGIPKATYNTILEKMSQPSPQYLSAKSASG